MDDETYKKILLEILDSKSSIEEEKENFVDFIPFTQILCHAIQNDMVEIDYTERRIVKGE